MADAEPSNTELAWRLAEIKELVQDIPGRREYTEYQIRVDERFKDTAEAIGDLRRTHTEDIKAVLERMDRHEADHKQREQEARKQRGADWRQAIYSGIAPFAIAIALMLITTLATKGGK